MCTHTVDQSFTGCGLTKSLQGQLRDHLPLLRATQATPATQTSLILPVPCLNIWQKRTTDKANTIFPS